MIETQGPVLVTDVVLAETVWTLTGKRYQFDKAAICEVVRGLIGDSAFRFESSQVIWSALMDYQGSKPVQGQALDFTDALISRKAHYVGHKDGLMLECRLS